VRRSTQDPHWINRDDPIAQLNVALRTQSACYDLRHTCATLLLIADENPKVVSVRLGHHSTIVLTLDTYSHVLPTMQRQATAKLEKMLYGEVGTPLAHKA
jgi:integrase